MKHDTVLLVQADMMSLQRFQFVYSDETFLVSGQIAQTKANKQVYNYYSMTKRSSKG